MQRALPFPPKSEKRPEKMGPFFDPELATQRVKAHCGPSPFWPLNLGQKTDPFLRPPPVKQTRRRRGAFEHRAAAVSPLSCRGDRDMVAHLHRGRSSRPPARTADTSVAGFVRASPGRRSPGGPRPPVPERAVLDARKDCGRKEFEFRTGRNTLKARDRHSTTPLRGRVAQAPHRAEMAA